MAKRKTAVKILAPAQREIEEIIVVYRRLSGLDSAQRLAGNLYKAFGRLADFPLSGLVLADKELQLSGYRYLLVEEYLVIYRIIEDVAYIYHAVHGATDYPKLFTGIK